MFCRIPSMVDWKNGWTQHHSKRQPTVILKSLACVNSLGTLSSLENCWPPGSWANKSWNRILFYTGCSVYREFVTSTNLDWTIWFLHRHYGSCPLCELHWFNDLLLCQSLELGLCQGLNSNWNTSGLIKLLLGLRLAWISDVVPLICPSF